MLDHVLRAADIMTDVCSDAPSQYVRRYVRAED
jgi:hypothetical protein